MKAQSAIEYLSTYGWAILIMSIVAVALFSLINLNSVTPQECILPAGLSCNNEYLAQNGILQVNLFQATQYPIKVTAIGCTSLQSLAYMQNIDNPPSNAVYMPISSNHTFYVQCYSNTTQFSGHIGSVYSGYLIINYTNAYTLFPTIVYGKMSTRVSR
ncbi:hypothetical protein M1590_00635 [Candidatus Marsarchaeota archaeon]|nr:hypothetical protein [Candidatus Marsarchaeota archaeon]